MWQFVSTEQRKPPEKRGKKCLFCMVDEQMMRKHFNESLIRQHSGLLSEGVMHGIVANVLFRLSDRYNCAFWLIAPALADDDCLFIEPADGSEFGESKSMLRKWITIDDRNHMVDAQTTRIRSKREPTICTLLEAITYSQIGLPFDLSQIWTSPLRTKRKQSILFVDVLSREERKQGCFMPRLSRTKKKLHSLRISWPKRFTWGEQKLWSAPGMKNFPLVYHSC